MFPPVPVGVPGEGQSLNSPRKKPRNPKQAFEESEVSLKEGGSESMEWASRKRRAKGGKGSKISIDDRMKYDLSATSGLGICGDEGKGVFKSW